MKKPNAKKKCVKDRNGCQRGQLGRYTGGSIGSPVRLLLACARIRSRSRRVRHRRRCSPGRGKDPRPCQARCVRVGSVRLDGKKEHRLMMLFDNFYSSSIINFILVCSAFIQCLCVSLYGCRFGETRL